MGNLNERSDIKLKKPSNTALAEEARKNIAASIYQSLKDEGCESKDIIGISGDLIGLVTLSYKTKADNNKKNWLLFSLEEEIPQEALF